ncbi:hypothetical protein CHS0354_015122 [Potamilus streckersoni]|uniref:EF-hand domain-containing protein n=1 Tax=Potamilus streckersoni TaxID=2493646 RepID=A0AAE0SS38_9BIVA|nr:hypothetical protein CHS0354_015122 [Potamilus streckersoni]
MEDRVNGIIAAMRENSLANNCGGIKKLSVIFRHMDTDYSRTLAYDEFKTGIRSSGLTISKEEFHHLFRRFDKDQNNEIDFYEFLHELRPPMCPERCDVINEAFDKLDVNKDGVIELSDLQVVYASNIKQHPKILSGEWTEKKALKQFLDTIDSPDCPDGKVTREEFMNYYSGVSSLVEDDAYFDLTMRSCFALPPKGTTH